MPDFLIHAGDCLEVLQTMPADSVDLIVTSPPYAERRKATYGGIPADEYVEWFIPRAEAMKRVLKPTGSFILNIWEHCHKGERHTYVLELVLAMRRAGWKWIEEYIWRKLNPIPGIAPSGCGTRGSIYITSLGRLSLPCTMKRFSFPPSGRCARITNGINQRAAQG